MQRGGDHPSRAELADFMMGALPPEKLAFIVRHLLAGCRSCSSVTAKLWDFAEEPLQRQKGARSRSNDFSTS